METITIEKSRYNNNYRYFKFLVSALADKKDHRDVLKMVCIRDGFAYATGGHRALIMPVRLY